MISVSLGSRMMACYAGHITLIIQRVQNARMRYLVSQRANSEPFRSLRSAPVTTLRFPLVFSEPVVITHGVPGNLVSPEPSAAAVAYLGHRGQSGKMFIGFQKYLCRQQTVA